MGRYEIVGHLARTDRAELLLARAEGFDRLVAIKQLRAEAASDRSAFLSEARLAATLHDPHIVQVLDTGEHEGAPYLAMEYVHGEDLRRILASAHDRSEHVPLGHALAIGIAAATALDAAGDVLHRDVSPANILVGYDGAIKLVDFGIARATRVKAPYLSPEQCTGKTLDRRSDVFSLGIVLYELVTGRRLFKASNEYLTMAAIVACQLPPPSARRPDLPKSFEDVILRALSRERAARYQTAKQLRDALEAVATDRSTTGALAAYVTQLCGERLEPSARAPIHVDFDGKGTGLAAPPAEALQAKTIASPFKTKTSPIEAARAQLAMAVTPVAPTPVLIPEGTPRKDPTAPVVPARAKHPTRAPVPPPTRQRPKTIQIPSGTPRGDVTLHGVGIVRPPAAPGDITIAGTGVASSAATSSDFASSAPATPAHPGLASSAPPASSATPTHPGLASSATPAHPGLASSATPTPPGLASSATHATPTEAPPSGVAIAPLGSGFEAGGNTTEVVTALALETTVDVPLPLPLASTVAAASAVTAARKRSRSSGSIEVPESPSSKGRGRARSSGLAQAIVEPPSDHRTIKGSDSLSGANDGAHVGVAVSDHRTIKGSDSLSAADDGAHVGMAASDHRTTKDSDSLSGVDDGAHVGVAASDHRTIKDSDSLSGRAGVPAGVAAVASAPGPRAAPRLSVTAFAARQREVSTLTPLVVPPSTMRLSALTPITPAPTLDDNWDGSAFPAPPSATAFVPMGAGDAVRIGPPPAAEDDAFDSSAVLTPSFIGAVEIADDNRSSTEIVKPLPPPRSPAAPGDAWSNGDDALDSWRPQRRWWPFAAVAGAAALLVIVLAFALSGGEGKADAPVATTQPTSASATRPSTAPVPVQERLPDSNPPVPPTVAPSNQAMPPAAATTVAPSNQAMPPVAATTVAPSNQATPPVAAVTVAPSSQTTPPVAATTVAPSNQATPPVAAAVAPSSAIPPSTAPAPPQGRLPNSNPPAPATDAPPTNQSTTAGVATTAQPTSRNPDLISAAKQPTTSKVAVEQLSSSKQPATSKVAVKQPSGSKQPATSKVATKQPATSKVATMQSTNAKQPTTSKVAVKQPTTAKVAAKQSTNAKQPTTSKVATTQQTNAKVATKQPSSSKQPATSKVGVKQPSSSKQPATSKVAVKQSSSSKQPATSKVATKQPATSKVATKQPTAKVATKQPAPAKVATKQSTNSKQPVPAKAAAKPVAAAKKAPTKPVVGAKPKK